ncbi:MAG: transcription antitermination protein NusB [Oscillatoriales cyanobacterium C42_A2020_001]|nr:transcription antitermination protein NusB [Leptolyngbyaceae cyanobacterium C42_A2020_001]
MQARRIARELALLSISQLPTTPENLETQSLQNVVVAAVRTLTTEAEEALETASAELKQSSNRLLSSQTRTTDVESARSMVNEAIDLAQTAINRLGLAIEIPEMVQLANQSDVRTYAMEIVRTLKKNAKDIDQLLVRALVDWQLGRLAVIDRDILRIAVTEMLYLGVPDRVAVNEAVELAKRYSGEDGYRFINGVLRRVTDCVKAEASGLEKNS